VISLVLVLLADVPPPPHAAECNRDSDCTIADVQDCCVHCCPGEPQAISIKELARHVNQCAGMDCSASPCEGKCPQTASVSDFEAVCRANRCARVTKVKPECAKDTDCRVDYPPIDEHAACRSSPCGCCPNTSPIAVPVSQARKVGPAPAPRPLTKKDDPKFGLNPGSVRPPQCSPCPAQEPAKAICSERHCVLDRPHAL
jgi:hypothetical protein